MKTLLIQWRTVVLDEDTIDQVMYGELENGRPDGCQQQPPAAANPLLANAIIQNVMCILRHCRHVI